MASGNSRYSTKVRAKRIALSYFKQPHPFRRWRLILSIAAPVVAALWLLVNAVQGDQRLYNSGTVSVAHQMFETDCGVCHGPGPKPGAITLAGAGPTGYWAAVTDNACTACHAGPQHNEKETFAPACKSCHIEHKGQKRLMEAADRHCTQCHGEATLQTKDGTKSRFHAGIKSLAAHPQFAIDVRPAIDTNPAAPDPAATKEPAPRVVLFEKGKAEAKKVDNTPIKLNHAQHVKVNIKGIDEVVKQQGMTGIVKVKEGIQLGCAYCHQPDESWRYMKPTTHKQHCAICHAPSMDTGVGPITAPHEAPAAVRTAIRAAAAELYLSCQSIPRGDAGAALKETCEGVGLTGGGAAPAAPAAPAEEQPRGRRRTGGDDAPATPAPEERPGRRRTGASLLQMPDGLRGAWLAGDGAEIIAVQDPPRRRRSGAEEEAPAAPAPQAPAAGGGGGGGAAATWLTQQVAAAEKSLYENPKDGCQKCHFVKKRPDSPLPEVLKPAIPIPWLTHSKFDHNPHRPVACVECHKAPDSVDTTDVLLPPMESCQQCHKERQGARTGCVECHRYHDKKNERSPDGPFKVPALLSGVGRKR